MSATPCESFIARLQGTWLGAGTMQFPTLPNKVEYEQRSTFLNVPEKTKSPFTHTSVASWKAGTDRKIGMHYDNGFMKCKSDREVEWTLSHNVMIAEVLQGTVNEKGTEAVFVSTAVANASEVLGTQRTLSVNDEGTRLEEFFSMRTVSVPKMTHHLHVVLNRVKESQL